MLLDIALIARWSWRGAAAASLLTDIALAVMSLAVVLYLRAKENRRAAMLTQAA